METLILLFFIFVCLFVYMYMNFNNTETFVDKDIDDVYNMDNKEIISLIPFFERNGYIAAVIDPKNPILNNLIYTNEIKSKNWKGPLKNCKLNDRSIIIDLCYDIDRHLLAIGMEMVSERPVYTIYKKENENVESQWRVLKSNSKTIRNVCYDFNGTMLGISSFDGQIYEYQGGTWVGPINYDKPMKKIFFDKDKIMLGVGLTDGYIYKKKGLEWRKTKWDTENMNKNRISDGVFDLDGNLIVATKNGVMKQTQNIYNSDFDDITKNNDNNEMLTKQDVLDYRCGIDFELYGYLESDDELSKNLNNILFFKKKAINVCQNKKLGISKLDPKQLLKQNQNQNLINEIDKQIYDLKMKGF